MKTFKYLSYLMKEVMLFSLLGKPGSSVSLQACQLIHINKNHRGKNHTESKNPSKSQWITTISCKSHICSKSIKSIYKIKPSAPQVDGAAVVVKSVTCVYAYSVQMKALKSFRDIK